MRTAAVAFLASTLVGAVLTPLVRDLALGRGLLDHALSSRKIHGRPIPRLGGIAIVLAFLAPLVALAFVDSGVGHQFWEHRASALGLVLGSVAIACLGIYDDLRGCRARAKLAVQFSVALAMYLSGFRIEQITHPFGAPLALGALSLPFTMLWIAGVINAMNLIDGLDGLAGGVSLIAVATIFTLAALRGQPLMLLFTAALGGAILGFLFYNFNPATIFMGDTGSMFLGFVLAVTSIRTSSKSTTAVALAVPILALGVPIADTLLAMGRRAIRGVPVFSADRGHIHHRLLDRGLSHRGAVLAIYAAAATMGGAALLLSFSNGLQSSMVLAALCLLGLLALRALGFLDLAKAQAAIAGRRGNLQVQGTIRATGAALRQAPDFETIGAVLTQLAPSLGAGEVALVLARANKAGTPGDHFGVRSGSPLAFRVEYPLGRAGDRLATLTIAWIDGRTELSRDTEIAIELLCDHLAPAVERIGMSLPAGAGCPPD